MKGINIGLAFLEITRAKKEAGEHSIPLTISHARYPVSLCTPNLFYVYVVPYLA